MATKNPYAKTSKQIKKQYERDRAASVQYYEPLPLDTDATDNLGKYDQYGKIQIGNLRASEYDCDFKAFITDFSDSYESNWNSTEVFGRMDPIWTYQNTKRTIRIAFDVPSFNEAEGKKNMENASKLIRMMYPTYQNMQGTAVIAEAPVFTLYYGNLICRATDGGPLKGVIPSFDFAPDIQQGFYTGGGFTKTFIPKTLKISLDFNVLHDHELGYNDKKDFYPGKGFPYLPGGRSTADNAEPAAPASSVTGPPGAPGGVPEAMRESSKKKALK
tara:strand:- start:1414 stop:2232 length:819 start_codon:yes stop_codon:yes gene_type:complete